MGSSWSESKETHTPPEETFLLVENASKASNSKKSKKTAKKEVGMVVTTVDTNSSVKVEQTYHAIPYSIPMDIIVSTVNSFNYCVVVDNILNYIKVNNPQLNVKSMPKLAMTQIDRRSARNGRKYPHSTFRVFKQILTTLIQYEEFVDSAPKYYRYSAFVSTSDTFISASNNGSIGIYSKLPVELVCIALQIYYVVYQNMQYSSDETIFEQNYLTCVLYRDETSILSKAIDRVMCSDIELLDTFCKLLVVCLSGDIYEPDPYVQSQCWLLTYNFRIRETVKNDKYFSLENLQSFVEITCSQLQPISAIDRLTTTANYISGSLSLDDKKSK